MIENQNNFKLIAKTLYGLENELYNELILLGARNPRIGNRFVSFYGDKGFMYKCNLCLRTAIKILKPIFNFSFDSQNDFYLKMKSFEWNLLLKKNQTFRVQSIVNTNIFSNSLFVNQRTKDAVVDFINENQGYRPNIDRKQPDITLNVHIQNKKCNVSLDTSGESLHKRGYKLSSSNAPISEVLAAGILLKSNWNGESNFLDPFCGSGTILIEAAMIASNFPPNFYRKEFAFERWKDWDYELFELIKKSLLKKVKKINFKMTGFDKSPVAISKFKENLKFFDFKKLIKVSEKNFFNSKKNDNEKLFIVTNPPYGERLTVDESAFYSSIGSYLKHNYSNSNFWMFTSSIIGIKNIGFKSSKKIKLKNGKIETYLLCYEIYKGSKKITF